MSIPTRAATPPDSGPEDYALAIIVTLHPGHDYGWLRSVPEVLDCTYRTPGGKRRFVL